MRTQRLSFLIYSGRLQSAGPGDWLIPLIQLSGPFGLSFEAAVLLPLSFLLTLSLTHCHLGLVQRPFPKLLPAKSSLCPHL